MVTCANGTVFAHVVIARKSLISPYVADYHPSGKKQYVEDFFTNLNWSVIEKNFEKVK